MESILNSIKMLLGIAEDYTQFDDDIIIHINSVFSILTQYGVGPDEGFAITDSSTKWSDYTSDDAKLAMVKTYIYLRVKQMFDPALGGTVAETIQRQIDELEWRLYIAKDPIAKKNNEE